MPASFTKEQQEEIREQLFHAGIRLSRALGIQRMTVSKLTASCGIAKGSFYSFYESKEEFIMALAVWADLFNPVNQMETARTWLSLISDTRENIDYGTVVNLIKSIYAMREHRDAMVEESLDNSIEMVLRLLEIYISGVILNAYDGFNPSEPETEFKSAMDEARRMGDYIVENYGGKIDILYGVSYGCRVVNEVLQDERLTITTTIMDGMSTGDYPDIKSEWGKNLYCFFLTGFFYQMMCKAGPVRKKILTILTGRSREETERLLYQKATWKSWKNQDYYLIGRKTNFEAFKKTDMYVWHGIKGSVDRKLARNMKKWKGAGYAFTYKVFTDLGHGGLAGEHPEQFLEEVTKAHENSLKNKQ